MAKSVRISDSLYEAASSTAALMQRSLAQQVEHWALLGQEFERSATTGEVMAAAVANMHARDAADVKAGKKSAASMYVIPPGLAKKAKAQFTAKSLRDFDVDR